MALHLRSDLPREANAPQNYTVTTSYGDAVLSAIRGGRRNLAFVIWTLGFPVADAGTSYLNFLARGSVPNPMSADHKLIVAWIGLVVWVGVAVLLYERRNESK